MEAQWPSDTGTASKLRWNRLKNVIFAAAQFRRSIQNGAKKSSSEQNLHALDVNDAMSANSLQDLQPNESNYFSIDFFALDKLRRLGNFVRQSDRTEQTNLRASVSSLSSVGGHEMNAKNTNTNGTGKDHEYDPHTNQRITADNIELLKELEPTDYRSDSQGNHDSDAEQSNGKDNKNGIDINGVQIAGNHSSNSAENLNDDEANTNEDEDGSPKK